MYAGTLSCNLWRNVISRIHANFKEYMKILISLILTLLTCVMSAEQIDVKVYTICTPSHLGLFRDWFLPSITRYDDITAIIKYCHQDCPTGEFMQTGWNATMLKKVDLIIEAIEENWGEVFIYSDVDIQFFGSIKDLILQMAKDHDFIVQRDTPHGDLCAGFFACRGNKKTLALWEKIRGQLELASSGYVNDQTLLQGYLKENNEFNISWNWLPNSFFGGGTFKKKLWKPGEELHIPEAPLMHHANWTIGIANKVAQLNYVKEKVELEQNNATR